MLKNKDNTFNARIQRNTADDSVILDAGSVVIDNKWIDYSGVFFNVKEYARNALDDQRVRFFTNLNYAVYLVLSIDITGSLIVTEGTQVPYTTLQSVPSPFVHESVPLIGIVIIQDGTTNLIDGIKPLNENNIIFYSGMGNVVDKNKTGIKGINCDFIGDIGSSGLTGLIGVAGLTGLIGDSGNTGLIGCSMIGLQGPQGITGINWDIEIPFNILL